ncbi:hypothetical protein ACSHDS_004168 [Vibrio alginolyticus]
MRKTKITYRKSFRLLGLVRINFGKPGFTSVSIGGRWLTLNMAAEALISKVHCLVLVWAQNSEYGSLSARKKHKRTIRSRKQLLIDALKVEYKQLEKKAA